MNEQEEKHIAKAFNAGYLMQQHEPQLLDKLLKGDNGNSEYMQAMAAGKKQQQKETLLQQQKAKQYQQQNNKQKRSR